VRDLANITLFSDGTTVYECTSAEEVVDLLQGGQGVFGIAVSGAMRELTGAIADFPGERADGGERSPRPRMSWPRGKTRDADRLIRRVRRPAGSWSAHRPCAGEFRGGQSRTPKNNLSVSLQAPRTAQGPDASGKR
jgi:hypothetical protein